MKKNDLIESIDEFLLDQKLNEKADNTVKKYKTNVNKFISWLDDDVELTKEITIEYKKYLSTISNSINSINNWIVSINKFFKYIDRKDLCIKKIKTQIKASNEQTLTLGEYKRMLRKSKEIGMVKLYYIMKTLAMTGIRISELEFFTVENITGKNKGKNIIVFNKGKQREIPIRNDLARELRKYCRNNNIKTGYIFTSTDEKSLVKANTTWYQMQKVAGMCKINKKKVHAHSFRHLFANVFLETYPNNITELADVMGHNSLETTRVYTRSSGEQKRKKIEKINFK